MRRRELSPEFWTDEKIVSVCDAAKLLFQGLWNLADREGRLEDKPVRIGFKVRPWDPNQTPQLLTELASVGLIKRATVDSKQIIYLPGFSKWQHVHPRELASVLPEQPEFIEEITLHGQPCNYTASPVIPGKADTNRAVSSVSSVSSMSSDTSMPSDTSDTSEPSLKDGPNAFALASPEFLIKTKPKKKPPNPETEFVRWVGIQTADEKTVFETYEAATGLTLGADFELLKFVTKKLKSHTVEEICKAIRGHAENPWNRERKNFSLRGMLSDATKIAINAQKAAQ